MITAMRYSHVALYVDDLRAAERFYKHVFTAEVLFREAVDAHGVWHTLPLEAGWDDAERAGVELEMVALKRDDIVFPIFAGPTARRIIGLEVAGEEIAHMRRRLPDEAEVVGVNEQQLVFVDPFDVQWQVRTGAGFRSSGEIHGRWLSLSAR
jgi:catechol 2,3-dioxygenase-like lactoylglutathione lyase family enzyme